MSTLSSLPSLDYYTVHYQTAPPLLRGLVLRPLSGPEFTEVCELLLAMAQHYGCRYWLHDGRADEARRPADIQDWMLDDFLPRAKDALGTAPYIAFVATATFWQDRAAQGCAPPGTLPGASHNRGFISEAAALRWFQEVSTPAEAITKLSAS